MLGYKFAKDSLKFAAGCSAVASDLVFGAAWQRTGCIFDYHRVAKVTDLHSELDNWNVAPKRFEKQIQWVAEETECVRLEHLPQLVRTHRGPKPLVALTFDDGYANFRYNALPLLQRYQLPATLFVVTRYLGSNSPFPFDSWGKKAAAEVEELAWRPLSWTELEQCVDSGLISIGSHSHNHFSACDCSDAELQEEAGVSRQLLQTRLGNRHGNSFCYPYGCSRLGLVPASYVRAVRETGYRMGLTTDLGLVQKESDPFLLPRLEAHGWDSRAILRAKSHGSLGGVRWLQGLRRQRHFEGGRSAGNGVQPHELGTSGLGLHNQ